MKTEYLAVTYGTSRGRDTYGYNLVTLRDETGKAYRTCGGGYDMFGAVLGKYLQTRYQDRLRQIGARFSQWNRDGSARVDVADALYGGTTYLHDGSVHLNGACGDSSMVRIAEAIGLTIRHTYSSGRRPHRVGVIVTDNAAQ